MSRHLPAVIFRLVFAAASLGAVGYQLFAIHIPLGYNVANFFSYFTNLSNIFISVVFIVTAVRLLRGAPAAPRRDTAIRGSAVVYIAFVGLVFNTLLTDVDISNIDPVVNAVCHMVMPVAGIVDWILWPPQNRLRARVILWWMIFPAAYAIFSVARGAVDGIYPYPFFNPGAVGGYGAVALYCAGMLVGFLVLSVIVWLLGNWRATASARRA